MSLVIGAVIEDRVVLMGDTAITQHPWHHEPRGERSASWTDGVLKVYRLNDTTAFGFANIIEDVSQVFGELKKCIDARSLAVCAEQLQSRGKKFDLLIGEVGYPRIRIVSDGYTIESREAFVGNERAYCSFKERCDAWKESSTVQRQADALEASGPCDSFGRYSRMFDSFKSLLDEHLYPDVGGILVPLCAKNGVFEYMIHTVSYAPAQAIPSGQWTPLQLVGTPEEGCYTAELCCGVRNRNLVGVYVNQGRFGVIFPPHHDRISLAERISASDPAEWALATAKVLGEALTNCWLQDHHCMLAAERALQEERELDAIFLYELKDWKRVFSDRLELRDRYVSGYAAALYNARRPIDALTVLVEYISPSFSIGASKMLDKIYAALPRCL